MKKLLIVCLVFLFTGHLEAKTAEHSKKAGAHKHSLKKKEVKDSEKAAS